jgi:hypothetical protein
LSCLDSEVKRYETKSLVVGAVSAVRPARMVSTHLEGILNTVVPQTTNAAAESMNARI